MAFQEIVIRIPTINDLLKEVREDNWTFRGDDETLKNELTAELHEQREVLLDGLN
jgi:Txe/YoeB family toxin of Txe-Axe toxin-antitoxin module